MTKNKASIVRLALIIRLDNCGSAACWSIL